MTDDVNYRAWGVDLMTLLDAIEVVADDEDGVRELCRARFSVTRQHGFTLHFEGPGNIGHA